MKKLILSSVICLVTLGVFAQEQKEDGERYKPVWCESESTKTSSRRA